MVLRGRTSRGRVTQACHRGGTSVTAMPQSESDPQPAVLYVDDESINLRVFEANFRSRFRVITCASGAEALEILSARPQEFAVLISDQRMPGMTGVELLEKARAIAPDVRRMLITAYADMQAVMDAVNRGQVVRYFVKPWVKDDLAAALEDAVGLYSLQLRLREIEARMLRSERLAAIGQVSAGVAHELMNPVSYMTQNVSTLRRELETLRTFAERVLEKKPDAEVRQTLEELPSLIDDIESGATHIRQIALTVRSQARGEDVESTADVHEVIDFAVKLARVELRQKARIQSHGERLKVRVGPVKLSQLVLNLVVNSAQAMDHLPRAGMIEIRWWREQDRCRIDVIDNGNGIPRNLQQKVFEPLFTTKPVGIGTGLGLSICRDIVTEAGGELRLRSTPGEGTTVELTLPLST